jgi:hypothetical protein
MASLRSFAARKPTAVMAIRPAAITGAGWRLNLKAMTANTTKGAATAQAIHAAGSTFSPR